MTNTIETAVLLSIRKVEDNSFPKDSNRQSRVFKNAKESCSRSSSLGLGLQPLDIKFTNILQAVFLQEEGVLSSLSLLTVFHTKVFCAVFFYLHFSFVIFGAKILYEKHVRMMLIKSTAGR